MLMAASGQKLLFTPVKKPFSLALEAERKNT
jgi:hypothetical protein